MGLTHTLTPTSYDLSAVWLRLQEAEERFGLVGAVHTCLYGVLQHRVHRAWSEMIRQLQHQLSVQMRPTLTMLVHVHAHWKVQCTGVKEDLNVCALVSVKNPAAQERNTQYFVVHSVLTAPNGKGVSSTSDGKPTEQLPVATNPYTTYAKGFKSTLCLHVFETFLSSSC